MLILCVILLSALQISTSAALPEQVSPQWENTHMVNAQLTFDGTEGTVSVIISGDTGVTNISAETRLFYKNSAGSWVEIYMDWGYNSPNSYLAFSDTFEGTPGVEYKIEMSATVTKGDVDELIEKTATAVCPSSN